MSESEHVVVPAIPPGAAVDDPTPEPRLVLPEGLHVADAVLYLPNGAEHHVPAGGRPRIPFELVHLDTDLRGIAVPWVSAVEGQSDRRRRRAIVDRLCGVCGFDLDYWKCWHVAAADEDAVRATRVMVVPPIHPGPCSEYAAAAYPVPEQGTAWWRYTARDYQVRLTTDGLMVAKVQPAKRVERLS